MPVRNTRTAGRRTAVPAKRVASRKAASAPAQPQSKKEPITTYATKAPTEYHKAFARFIVQVIGYDPDQASSKKAAFLRGVAIATAARPAFQSSDFIEQWREATGEAKRGPKGASAAPTPATKRRKPAPEPEPEVDEEDDFEEEVDEDEDDFEDDSDSEEEDEDSEEDEEEDEEDDEDADDDFEEEVEEEPAPKRRSRPAKSAPVPATRTRTAAARKAAPAKKATPAKRTKPAADDDEFLF